MKFDPYKFKTVESHGIRVHLKNVPWANGFVYVSVLISAGGLQDPLGQEGTAHFLEHMPFNGCIGWPTKIEIEQVKRDVFMDTLNAWTSFDGTCFYGKVSKTKLAEACRFLSAFIFSPILNSQEVERERGVIIQELWRSFSNIKQESLERNIRRIICGDHPFGRMSRVLGWHDTVEKITRENLFSFHNSYYHRGNTQLVLVGDVDELDVSVASELIARGASTGEPLCWPTQVTQIPGPNETNMVTSVGEFYGIKGDALPKSSQISLSRLMPKYKNRQILELGKRLISHLLYDEIRGKLGAVYTPSVKWWNGKDIYFFFLSVKIAPEATEATRNIIDAVLLQISEGDSCHSAIFEELKLINLDSILYIDHSASDIAKNSVDELSVSGRISSLEEDYEEARKVSYADVALLFSREMTPQQTFIHTMTP